MGYEWWISQQSISKIIITKSVMKVIPLSHIYLLNHNDIKQLKCDFIAVEI